MVTCTLVITESSPSYSKRIVNLEPIILIEQSLIYNQNAYLAHIFGNNLQIIGKLDLSIIGEYNQLPERMIVKFRTIVK